MEYFHNEKKGKIWDSRYSNPGPSKHDAEVVRTWPRGLEAIINCRHTGHIRWLSSSDRRSQSGPYSVPSRVPMSACRLASLTRIRGFPQVLAKLPQFRPRPLPPTPFLIHWSLQPLSPHHEVSSIYSILNERWDKIGTRSQSVMPFTNASKQPISIYIYIYIYIYLYTNTARLVCDVMTYWTTKRIKVLFIHQLMHQWVVLKRNIKIYIKIYIKTSPPCFGTVTPSSGSQCNIHTPIRTQYMQPNHQSINHTTMYFNGLL